jgi:ribosomal protein L37E
MLRIFPFEKEVVGKNIHSVITVCPQCGSHGVNMPLEKECGNCGYTETRTYYDAETIHNLLQSASPNKEEDDFHEGMWGMDVASDSKESASVASHSSTSSNSNQQ